MDLEEEPAGLGKMAEREIERARALESAHGAAVRADAGLMARIEAYRREIDRTWEVMAETGVTVGCARCVERYGESCCFQGVEEQFDAVLLWLNLLLGYDLPAKRELPGSCLFVGPRGCKLRARPYFCIHYLCPPLQARLGPAALERLETAASREIGLGLEAEQALRAWLKSRPG
jgi:hypothetical protein